MRHTFAALRDLFTSSALAVVLFAYVVNLVLLLDEACAAARASMIGPTLTHIACVLLGAGLLYVLQVMRGWSRDRERKALPPATTRQLDRARRANRLEVRTPPPRWIPLPKDHFTDSEDTR